MSEWQEVKSLTVSWGKIGDSIEGTLTDIRERDVRDDLKGIIRKKIYEVKADAGSYHEVDAKRNPVDPPVKVNQEDFYLIWGGKEAIDNGMKKAKLGQKIKVAFTEEIPPKVKGRSPFKVIKIYVGAMDDAWLGVNTEINPAEIV